MHKQKIFDLKHAKNERSESFRIFQKERCLRDAGFFIVFFMSLLLLGYYEEIFIFKR